jgi:hypothetical protein
VFAPRDGILAFPSVEKSKPPNTQGTVLFAHSSTEFALCWGTMDDAPLSAFGFLGLQSQNWSDRLGELWLAGCPIWGCAVVVLSFFIDGAMQLHPFGRVGGLPEPAAGAWFLGLLPWFSRSQAVEFCHLRPCFPGCVPSIHPSLHC